MTLQETIHALNNLLSVVLINLEFLDERLSDAESKQLLAEAQQAAAQIKDVVRRLADREGDEQ
jgi:RNase H-fold protein (predicted Holliday junction resolvase)